jgi:hypothetical protein
MLQFAVGFVITPRHKKKRAFHPLNSPGRSLYVLKDVFNLQGAGNSSNNTHKDYATAQLLQAQEMQEV